MAILNASANLSTVDIYRLTKAPNTRKMKDAKGERIALAKWAVYEDVNKKTGEVQNILAIATPEGDTYATNSPTFVGDFLSMMELFNSAGETVPAIMVESGMSKAGREFITCVYSE